MNSFKQIKIKYASLSEREQRLIQISAVVVVFALFYWGLWTPLNQGVNQQQQLLNNNQKLHSWIAEQAMRATQLRGAQGISKPTAAGSLPQIVSATSGQYSLTISRMQPQGDELQVWLDDAPFNTLLDWLYAIEQQGVIIQQLDLSEADDAGKVKVRRLVLSK